MPITIDRNGARRRCPSCGHMSPGRPAFKITARIRAAILRSNEPAQVVAARYGITRQSVYAIKPGKRSN